MHSLFFRVFMLFLVAMALIVGTGHLVGRDGVVDLLKRDGIQAIQR